MIKLVWSPFEYNSRRKKQTFPGQENISRMRDKRCLIMNTVNVLKYQTIAVGQKDQDKQCQPRSSSLIRVFHVCDSDKHFVNSSPENQHFNGEQKVKSV